MRIEEAQVRTFFGALRRFAGPVLRKTSLTEMFVCRIFPEEREVVPHSSAPVPILFLEKALSEDAENKGQEKNSNKIHTILALCIVETHRTVGIARTITLRLWSETLELLVIRSGGLIKVNLITALKESTSFMTAYEIVDIFAYCHFTIVVLNLSNVFATAYSGITTNICGNKSASPLTHL